MGGFPKILRNFQSGSWQMLTSNYKVGGWGKKRPKICLRNILMVPIQNRRFLAKLDILLPFLLCSISFSMSGDFVSKRKPMETKLACMYIYFDIYDFFFTMLYCNLKLTIQRNRYQLVSSVVSKYSLD